MPLKNLFHHNTSFDAWDRASSSVSVLDVVMVFCFVEHQSTGPLNIFKRYLSVLYLMIVLSANAASLAQITADWSVAEYLIVRLLVSYKYEMTRSTAS